MKKQFYFGEYDDEFCYELDHFIADMNTKGIKELKLYKAEQIYIRGVFWCKEHSFCAEKGTADCGVSCNEYEARNGKSGVCKHHSRVLYEKGEEIIIKK